MEPPHLVKLVGGPKVKRNMQKDEASKRQGEWSASRKGRTMSCSNCGEPNHNARGCTKPSNAQSKGKQTMKRKRTVDYEDINKKIPLSGPQQSQNSQASNSPLVFIPTPTIFDSISNLRDVTSRRL
uniref:CCHC-type domain-containing protein n=1 Tax=Nicotiana tabacum TaxID=4097 RepID=A0A1S3ZYF8_TOBAC|nr:PREDICTED: uncharacterized protein LOC107791727 [Nicotiana tabacum]